MKFIKNIDIGISNFDRDLIRQYLLEIEKHSMSFSRRQKLYYNFVRYILPEFIRKKVQYKYSKNIEYKENFIWDDFVVIFKRDRESWEKFINSIYPENYKTAIVLTHDVETLKGLHIIPKVIELEEKYGFKSSWNLVPYKYQIAEDIFDIIKKSGNEIGIHGYNHDGKLYYSKEIFDSRVPKINEALKKYNAFGFRSPMVHRNLKWLQELDIEYDMSCFDYDPFQPFPGGTGCIWPFIAGKFVELPYTLPQDHTLFYVLKQKNINIWKRKVDWLVENHGMILVLTHPDYLMEKDHLKYYEELLGYLGEIEGAWRCLPREMGKRVMGIEDYPLNI